MEVGLVARAPELVSTSLVGWHGRQADRLDRQASVSNVDEAGEQVAHERLAHER